MTLATLLLAAVNLSLSNVLWWLLVGLVAGFLASRVMRGGGYGLIGDIVVGLIGAFIGGWLAGFLGLGLLWSDRDYCGCLYRSLYSACHLTCCHSRIIQGQTLWTVAGVKEQ